MYKIGAFAKLCQLSVQTLRYYERLGLIEPEHTDPFTSYRYYAIKQLEQVNRIQALKELGLSLDQIRELMHEQITTKQIEAMLKVKYREIQQLIEAEIDRLQHIEFHLHLLEQESKMIQQDMNIQSIEATRILSYKTTFPADEAGREFFKKARQAVVKAKIPLIHNYVVVLNEHEYERRLEDLEIAFLVEDDFDGTLDVDGAEFTVRTVPAVENALTLMHKGKFEGEQGMQESVRLAFMWMAQNGYKPESPVRVSYLALAPDVPEEEQLRQIQIPIRKVLS